MSDTHELRRQRLRDLLIPTGAACALVTRWVNVRYLTGFTGSNGAVLVTPDGAVLATDGRYRLQAAAEAPDCEALIERDVAVALVRRAGGEPVAVEEHDLTVEQHRDLVAAGGRLTDLGRGVERLRVVKDEEELQALRTACALSTAALEQLLPRVRAGQTERELATTLERLMVDAGADGRAFDTIVAGGPHSAIPHHQPTDRPVERGDLLKIDFGALYRGYHADCTRTYVVGAPPAAWQRDLHLLVHTAQRAGRLALAPGAATAEVDRAARAAIEDAGHGADFPHGLGHGVGLEIHEAPMVGASTTGRLAACVPVTVEPGVYLEGRGGVRIEDTLVVPDPAGPAELLTQTPRDLIVLG